MATDTGVTFGIMAILFALLGVVLFGFWIMALIDLLKYTDQEYVAAGSTKIVWVLVVVLVGGIGGLIYWFSMRPKLQQLRARGSATYGPPPGSNFGQQAGPQGGYGPGSGPSGGPGPNQH